MERGLERDYNLRTPECRTIPGGAQKAHFTCVVISKQHIKLRLAVEQKAGRRPVITACGPEERLQDHFITCSVKPRS
jgi:hypothetical protein